MKYELTMLLQGRKNFLELLEPLNNKLLNQVPVGFRNNLAWNFGHVIVSQQLLCYQLSGLEPIISTKHIERFRSGTIPETNIDPGTVDELNALALELPELFIDHYHQGIFKSFKSYQSRYGVKVSSIEDAMVFNNIHEGLHLGFIMAMRKLIVST